MKPRHDHTADMFATGEQVETLTLLGQHQEPAETFAERVERLDARRIENAKQRDLLNPQS